MRFRGNTPAEIELAQSSFLQTLQVDEIKPLGHQMLKSERPIIILRKLNRGTPKLYSQLH